MLALKLLSIEVWEDGVSCGEHFSGVTVDLSGVKL